MKQLTTATYRKARGLVVPFFITLLGIIVLTSCDSLLSSMDDEPGSATFNVLLTDAPFPFDLVEEANVTITEVQLVPADAEDDEGEESEQGDNSGNSENGENGNNGEDDSDDGEGNADEEDNEQDEGDGDDDDEGIITLKSTWGDDGSESISYDLLELRNGITADLVSGADIPAGTYYQVRLIVDEEATLVATDGSTYDLKIPSGTQTGVKIQLDNLEVGADAEKTLVLDFNLEDSFVARGNINNSADLQGIIFKPVVHLQSITDGPPENEENDESEEEEVEEENEEEEENENSDQTEGSEA